MPSRECDFFIQHPIEGEIHLVNILPVVGTPCRCITDNVIKECMPCSKGIFAEKIIINQVILNIIANLI